MPATVPPGNAARTGEIAGAMPARAGEGAGMKHFTTVVEVERARGPLHARDREIAYLYLDLGLSAAECGRRLYLSQTLVLRRLAACGIARRPAGGSPFRLDDRQLERAAFLYVRAGLSLAAIARLEGVHPNAVRHRLRAAGVALRPPGRQAAFGLGGRDAAT
jgi:DNA-binding CsgD family transcriptional regulator